MGWWSRLRPGTPDVVFGIVLIMSLIGGRSAFLNDPGTFWHIELGRQILQTGDVPRETALPIAEPTSPGSISPGPST